MKKSILYILGIVLLQACTERIEFDLGEQGEAKVAIDAIIDNLSTPDTVVIRKTTSFYEPAGNDIIADASVVLSGDGNSYTFTPIFSMPGYYVSPLGFIANPGSTYTLNILADGKEYIATERMPPVINPDTAYLEENTTIPFEPEDSDDGDRWYSVKVTFQEPIGVKNFYFIRYLINGKDRSTNLSSYASYVEDTFFSDEYLVNVDLGTLYLYPQDTVDFLFGSINEKGYDIWSALVEESEFRGGFFDGPPANIPSNWSNGGLGLFMPVSYSKKIVVAP